MIYTHAAAAIIAAALAATGAWQVSNSSLHVCQATRDAVARDIARHGDVGAFIAGLPVVQTRINRHGRTVRFTV